MTSPPIFKICFVEPRDDKEDTHLYVCPEYRDHDAVELSHDEVALIEAAQLAPTQATTRYTGDYSSGDIDPEDTRLSFFVATVDLGLMTRLGIPPETQENARRLLRTRPGAALRFRHFPDNNTWSVTCSKGYSLGSAT